MNNELLRLLRSILILLVFLLSILMLSGINQKEAADIVIDKSYEGSKILPMLRSDIEAYQDAKTAELERQLQLAVRREEKIDNLTRVFNDYGGYMTREHAEVMVTTLDRCGGDYRVLGAIAGKESGFGRINYKLYNPFGYLNGVQYPSYEIALESLSCQIAKQYLVPCNNDFLCIATSGYAGPDTDVPAWIRALEILSNRIEPV